MRQRPAHYLEEAKAEKKPSVKEETKTDTETEKPVNKPVQKKKLTYKDQREYDLLPEKLETLEAEIEAISAVMAEPDFYSQDQATVQAKLAELQTKEGKLEAAFERWEELEGMIS
ncbi:hypothetical protein THIOSC13_1310001 [uncultured Thiomicrorhabdus sp.]